MNVKNFGHRIYGAIVKLFTTKKTDIVYLGTPIQGPSVLISNHEAAAGPLTWEFNLKVPKRFWATHEMTEGVKSVFRYLAYYYFPEKKHFHAFISRLIGWIGAPFVCLFFSGLRPIPTYSDGARLASTFRESERCLDKGDTLIIFPEDSAKGYFEKPKHFFSGFVVLCDWMYRKGRDLPVYVAYFSKQKSKITVDRPLLYSELRKRFGKRDAIAQALCMRMRELAGG